MNIHKNKIFLLIGLGLCLPIIFTCHNTADNRLHEDKEQKSIVISRVFKEMNVITDINERLIVDLTMIDSTVEDFLRLMRFAQEAAANDKSDCIDLRHLDRAQRSINFGLSTTNHDDTQMYKTAHHEAAHAVVSLVQDSGYSMSWVSIQPHNDSLGHVYYSQRSKQLTESQRLNSMNRSLAGPIAEQVFGIPEKCEFNSYKEMLIDFFKRGSQGDWALAKQECEILALTQLQKRKTENCVGEVGLDINTQDDETELHNIMVDILKAQYYATIELVTNLQPAISAVAQELLEKKVISYKRVQTIIQETGCLK